MNDYRRSTTAPEWLEAMRTARTFAQLKVLKYEHERIVRYCNFKAKNGRATRGYWRSETCRAIRRNLKES